MQLVLSLLQQMSVSLVIAYLFSKSPLLRPLANYSVRLPHKVLIYVIFSCFCILGTYVGLDIDDAIANTRAVGAVLGGLLGGANARLKEFQNGFSGKFFGKAVLSCFLCDLIVK